MNKLELRFPNGATPVFIGENIFLQLPRLLKKQNAAANVFIVVDAKVKRRYADLISAVANELVRCEIFAIKADEKNKSFEGLSKIFARMLKKNFGRDTTLIAIGGGVIGDLAGFAAATFARGIKLVQVPTTLLAMVDSSIGGKTGINFGEVKNIVGAFYRPEFILTDVAFAQSLSRDDLISGLGEIVKYGFLADEKFFGYVEKNLERFLSKEKSVLKKAVLESAKVKISVVQQDEKEAGLRKILNLGHTFAHAFESASDYKLSHGKAVMLGIYAAIHLGVRLEITNENLAERYLEFISKLKKDFPKISFDEKTAYSVMLNDKKNRDGKIKFVLPINFGELALDVEAPKKEVFRALREVNGFLMQ